MAGPGFALLLAGGVITTGTTIMLNAMMGQSGSSRSYRGWGPFAATIAATLGTLAFLELSVGPKMILAWLS